MVLNVGKVGLGLMGFTWSPNRKFTQEQFNKILKHAIDQNKSAPLFLNSGEFYGIPERHENIQKLGAFFQEYPDYADKVVVSVKGGGTAQWQPDNSAENLDKTFAVIKQYLQPLYDARKKLPKTLDFYTIARLGEEPIEQTLGYIAEHHKKGDFDKLCISEVDGPTLKKVNDIYPVALIENEFSMFVTEFSTNGSFEVAAELGIPVAAYSPLGKGLLVGLKPEDLPEGDFRKLFDKFQPANFDHNSKLVSAIANLAKAKNATPSQIALSWIIKQSGATVNGVKFPQIIPIPGSTNEERLTENFTLFELSDKDLEEINSVLASHEVVGARYLAGH